MAPPKRSDSSKTRASLTRPWREPSGGEPSSAAPASGALAGAAPVGAAPVGGAPVGGAPVGAAPVGAAPVGGSDARQRGERPRRDEGDRTAPPPEPEFSHGGAGERRRGSAWRHANAVEAALRPAAVVRDRAHEAERASGRGYARIGGSVAATGGVAVAGSIVLYRRELQRERLARPPMLRGEPLPGVVAYVRPAIALAAWRDGVAALGVGVALWLAVLAMPRTRRWALRWGLVPALLGVLAWLGARWLLT